MRKIAFLVIVLFMGFSASSVAQEDHILFSVDSIFLDDLIAHFHAVGEFDQKDSHEILTAFAYYWNAKLIFPDQKRQTQKACQGMMYLKLSVSPFFTSYLKAITLFTRFNYDQRSFDVLNKSVLYCMNAKNPSQALLAYLNQVNLLLEQSALLKTNTDAWYCRRPDFRFEFDSVPAIDFSSVTLVCSCRGDSSCINDTRGRFLPVVQKWYGSKGVVYWDREGLSRDEVFAKLNNYTLSTRVTYYSADSVILYHGGFFKKPLIGKLEEKVMADVVPEKAIYPKFTMYEGGKVIINLNKNIVYEGGFSLEGAKVVGYSTENILARIRISRKELPFIELRSKEFIIRPDRFVSARANAVIYIDNDSIFHPGVQIRYNRENNEIAMTRSDEGITQSPFFDSYHRIDMIPEALYYKLDDTIISFEAVRGIRSKGEAMFASSDYFSAYEYDKLQGIDDINPAFLVSAYIRKRNTDRFYVQDLAEYERKPIEQVKVQLIKLANQGFVLYDIDNDVVTIKARLNEYLASHNGAKDYDIIQFKSSVEKGSNAILNLKNNNLTILGVQHVMLSDSQFVYIVPKDRKIILQKNRDFIFMGRVHAGLFDFYAHQVSFDYDKFLMNLPEIDSLAIAVPSWEVDQGGYHHLVRVKNVLADMSGVLEIDAPNSKSGRKSFQEYPRFTSKDNSYVYFDNKNIVKGVYNRENFYYTVEPFSMDSLNRLTTENIRFKGRLISGNILPDIEEPLSVQHDYSLGFQKVLPSPGLPLYGGKGMFSDTLRLSNKGLRGSGTLNYLASTSKSDNLLFCPDSTTGKVQNYVLDRRIGQAENPYVNVKEANIKWVPGKDVMYIRNSAKEKFNMFNNQANMDGDLALSPGGLKGDGLIAFEDAEIKSNSFKFNSNAFSSDTSDFTLFTPDHKDKALKVHVLETEIDFTNRLAHFAAKGVGAVMELPVNRINCVVDEFDWFMDKKQLQLVNQTSFSKEKYMHMTPEELINLNPDDERYVFTDPKKESLRFFAMTALYDLTTNVLQVEDARIVRVADAAIFPKDGKLTVSKGGVLGELAQSSIIANRDERLHTVYNASVSIESKNSYTGDGLYDYVPSDGDIETIHLRHIAVENGNSYALASLPDSLNFTLNRYFNFSGNMVLHAERKELYFEGGYQMKHNCTDISNEWVKIRADLDPKNIMIPVEGDIENTGNGKLRVSVFYSMTANTLKSGFFVKPDNITDQDLITANGLLTFDPVKGEYRVTTEAKHKDPSIAGNLLALSNSRCILRGEGLINLTGDLGRLTMKSAGRINYIRDNDSSYLNILTALDFFFSDDAMKIMADDFNAADLKGIDISNVNYTRPLREMIGQQDADKLLTELSVYGQYRKFPEVLFHTLMLADLNLYWDKDTRSFLNSGPIGISNVGRISVNRYVKGHIEILKRRTGDMFNIYLEASPDKWYFFSYTAGTMQAISSNKAFNDKLVGLKEDQRVIKSGNGKESYQFLVSTSDKKATFLRKMKQLKGE